MLTPKISVLMPVFNGERYLREAVESILNQTLTDFEFIIIDDGSTDRSIEILSAYTDPRLKIIRNQANIGVSQSLNKGLDLALGEYIARMDSDDISLPERFARQVAFMDSHPEIAVCGTWVTMIDAAGRVVRSRPTPTGQELELNYWRSNPIIHPSVLIRASQLGELRYDDQILYAQDFDLWFRMKSKYRLDNLPEYLLLYRMHKENITKSKNAAQRASAYEIFRRHTGAHEISYDEWLALTFRAYKINPLRRALLTASVASKIHQPYRAYLENDLTYTSKWLDFFKVKAKQRVRNAAGRLRATYRRYAAKTK